MNTFVRVGIVFLLLAFDAVAQVSSGGAALPYTGTGSPAGLSCPQKGPLSAVTYAASGGATPILFICDSTGHYVQSAGNNPTVGANSLFGNNSGSPATGTSLSAAQSGALIGANTSTGNNSYAADSGAVNAAVVTLNPAPTSLTNGLTAYFLPAANNTSTTPTLNLNSLGAVTIVGLNGALQTGDLNTGKIAEVIYNGSNWVLQNGVVSQTTTIASGNSILGNNTGSAAPASSLTPAQASLVIGSIGSTGNHAYAADSGAVNAAVVTLSPAPSSLTTGQVVYFKPIANSTSTTPTLNLNSLGAVTIVNQNGALAVGDLSTSIVAQVVYNGTNWVLQNGAVSSGVPIMPANTVAGNNTGSSAIQQNLTPAQAAALIGSNGSTANNAYAADTGAVNAAVVTLLRAPASLTAGLSVFFKPTATNTSTTPTLNLNGLGAVTIVGPSGSAVNVGDLNSSAVAQVIYNGTNWVLQNGYVATAGTVLSANSIAGNNTGSSGPAQSLTPSQAASLITAVTTSNSSLQTMTGPLAAKYVNSPTTGSETVTFSNTPTFSINYSTSYIALSANITTFTLASGQDGQMKTLTFCQNTTGGYTVTAPSNVTNFAQINPSPSSCTSETFTFSSVTSAWNLSSPGAGSTASFSQVSITPTWTGTGMYCSQPIVGPGYAFKITSCYINNVTGTVAYTFPQGYSTQRFALIGNLYYTTGGTAVATATICTFSTSAVTCSSPSQSVNGAFMVIGY